MKYIYAVKDLAIQAFGIPFFLRSKGEAMRSFTDEVNKKNSDSAIAQHPEDYELYELGLYDEEDGKIESTGIQMIARAKDFIIREE